jgi:hypothetical protein
MSPDQANPLGATYGHLVLFENRTINGILLHRQPLYEGAWSGKTGFSELMPREGEEWQDCTPWTRRLKIDLPAVRAYVQAVYENTDGYLASLSPDDLDRSFDLSGVGMPGSGTTLRWILGRRIVGHVDNIAGEISCLKGLQSLRGYPF